MAMDKEPRNESNLPNRRRFLGNAGSGLIVAGGAMACGSGMEAQSSPPSPPAQYRLIRVRGTHREMGRQHGEQASEQIRTHIDQMSRSREQLNAQASRFKPLFEKHCPHLLDEITGLAEGARITLAEALAVNIRGELRKTSPEGCTTYVIS